ncbi:MAG: orotate phosphoribosyltransferase [candidate division WOR-3 bacterium]
MTDINQILKEKGVLLEGHFLLTSGNHSDRYFEKFRILEHPDLCELFAREIAKRFRSEGITVVCGPTTGGVIIAYEVARQLGCRCVIAEKATTGRQIGRGFQLGPMDRALVVDDVLTTGGSINETLAALARFPSKVVGIAVFIDRSSGVCFDQPFFAVYRQEIRNFPPDNCPLCQAGIPLQEPGRSGKK